MAKPVSDEARSEIEKLCRKVSVAAELDEAIQRELADHMQDKLAAYLSGEQPVSEADALLLVKHHFGDVRAIRAMYRRVHVRESLATLGRRLVAAAVATLFWMSFVSVVYTGVSRAMNPRITSYEASTVVWLAIFITAALMNLGGLWATLVWWKRRGDAGEQMWFMRMQPLSLAMILLGFLAIWISLPAMFGPPGEATGRAYWVARYVVVGVGLIGYSGGFLRALAWTWFCGLSVRRPRELLGATLIWGCFMLVTSALSVTWWPRDPMHFDGQWQLIWLPVQMTSGSWIRLGGHAGMAAGTMLGLAVVMYCGERLRRRWGAAA